jgi:hypothetical protein
MEVQFWKKISVCAVLLAIVTRVQILSSVDPETQRIAQLFNPRLQSWEEHFLLEQERIVGLTSEGRTTVFLLHFNDEERLFERRLLLEAGYFRG